MTRLPSKTERKVGALRLVAQKHPLFAALFCFPSFFFVKSEEASPPAFVAFPSQRWPNIQRKAFKAAFEASGSRFFKLRGVAVDSETASCFYGACGCRCFLRAFPSLYFLRRFFLSFLFFFFFQKHLFPNRLSRPQVAPGRRLGRAWGEPEAGRGASGKERGFGALFSSELDFFPFAIMGRF